MMEDLPTLGRPTMASLSGPSWIGRRDASSRYRSPRPGRVCRLGGRFRRPSATTQRRLHQGIDALAVNGADGKNFSKPQLGEFRRGGFGAVRVGLVDRHKNRLAGSRRRCATSLVQRHDAFLHIDDQDDDVGGFDGQLHLVERGLG